MDEQEIKNGIAKTINSYFEVYEVYLKNRSEKVLRIWEQDDRDTLVNWIYDSVIKGRDVELTEIELIGKIKKLLRVLEEQQKEKANGRR